MAHPTYLTAEARSALLAESQGRPPAHIDLPLDRRSGERRVTRDRRGAVRVVDTDGTLVIRPADPASSAWMPVL